MDQDLSYPRPQLRRDRWTDLAGPWGFAYDDGDVGLVERWCERWCEREDPFDRTIEVPYPPESKLSGIGDTSPRAVVWYRRTFRTSDVEMGDKLLLHFGAVDYEARVWLNGKLVAVHQGGHTPFTADLTAALGPADTEQVIVVRAQDSPTDLAQPRGKQFWEEHPRSIWYHRTTGIWQPVWLESVAADHITAVRWTPDLDRGMLGLDVSLDRAPTTDMRLRVKLSLRGEPVADESYAIHRQDTRRAVGIEPAVSNIGRWRLLWSPEHPNLLDAELTLESDGKVVDVVHSYAGLRSAAFSDGSFLLNGVPTYLRLVLDQGYWPESHLAAPDGEALRRDVECIKGMGFNGVRIHQKVEDPRFLYWCDRLGLMVWGEMANAYAFSPTAVERLVSEWTEVLRRDYSHPCIVTWVPLNESWGVPNLPRDPAQRDYVRALYHLTKALDPTRPVIGNDGWEHFASDAWGIHDYATRGKDIRERYGSPAALEHTLGATQPQHHAIALEARKRVDEPIILSECGGLNYDRDPSTGRFGYGVVDSPEELLARYDELVSAILDSSGIAGFCYTQFSDTEQESNGLLYGDRSCKVDTDALRAINHRPSKAIPGDFVSAIQAATEVTSFSPGGSVG
jgi:beta-galactosidase/beta-glucuronidase